MSKQATFTEMLNGTAEDYAIIGKEGSEHATHLPDRILAVSYTHLTLPTKA